MEVDAAAASGAVPTLTATTAGFLRRFFVVTPVVVLLTAVAESVSWSAADDVDASSASSTLAVT